MLAGSEAGRFTALEMAAHPPLQQVPTDGSCYLDGLQGDGYSWADWILRATSRSSHFRRDSECLRHSA